MRDRQYQLKLIRGLDLTQPSTAEDKQLQKLKPGAYLDLNGQTYCVTGIARYLDVKWKDFSKRKQDYWVTELELTHLLSGSVTYIEWEFDDELEVTETLKEIKLRDLSFNGKPLTRADLEYIADEEYGEVIYQGKTFHYVEDDTWAALYYRNDNQSESPFPVRMYEFAADDDTYLTVEAWEEGDDRPSREAFLSRPIPARSIVILKNG
jgi:hypothetical protein